MAQLLVWADEVQENLEAGRSEATRGAYDSDWNDFEAWCLGNKVIALPADPAVVAAYLSDLATRRKVSTVQRRMSAIASKHLEEGHHSPTKAEGVRRVIRGIHGLAQQVRQSAPAVTATIRKMVAPLTDELIDQRDRALLLVRFAGAFRRSELVDLQ